MIRLLGDPVFYFQFCMIGLGFWLCLSPLLRFCTPVFPSSLSKNMQSDHRSWRFSSFHDNLLELEYSQPVPEEKEPLCSAIANSSWAGCFLCLPWGASQNTPGLPLLTERRVLMQLDEMQVFIKNVLGQ